MGTSLPWHLMDGVPATELHHRYDHQAVLREIPGPAVAPYLECMATALAAAAVGNGNAKRCEQASRLLLLLPRMLLSKPPRAGKRFGPRNDRRHRNAVADRVIKRCALFMAGSWEHLLAAIGLRVPDRSGMQAEEREELEREEREQRKTRSQVNRLREKTVAKRDAQNLIDEIMQAADQDHTPAAKQRRVCTLVAFGELSKAAMQVEGSAKLAPGNDATTETVRSLFPQGAERVARPPSLNAARPRRTEVAMERLEQTIRSLRRGAAQGHDSTYNEHFRLLIGTSQNEKSAREGALKALADWTSMVLAGDFPDAVAQLLNESRVIALLKEVIAPAAEGQREVQNIRPVRISTALSALACKFVCIENKTGFVQAAGKRQLGIGVSGGVEAVAHAAMAFMSEAGGEQRALLLIDVVNAHNCIQVKPTMEALEKHPALYAAVGPLIYKLYGRGTARVSYTDNKGTVHSFLAPVGWPQGVSLSTMLFAVGIAPIVENVMAKHQRCELLLIHDDMTLMAETPEAALACAMDLRDELRDRLGLTISLSQGPVVQRTHVGKTQLWSRAALTPSETRLGEALGVVLVPASQGVKVVGAPVGTTAYMAAFVAKKLETVTAHIRKLAKYSDVQVALLLIRQCFLPRASWLQKVVPDIAEADRVAFDKALADAMATLLDLPLGVLYGTKEHTAMTLPLVYGGLSLTPCSSAHAGIDFLTAALQARDTLVARRLCARFTEGMSIAASGCMLPRPAGAESSRQLREWRLAGGVDREASIPLYIKGILRAFEAAWEAGATVKEGQGGREVRATLVETLASRDKLKSERARGERSFSKDLRRGIYTGVSDALIVADVRDDGGIESEQEALRRSNFLAQQGPHAATPFAVLPVGPATTIPGPLMKILLALRFRLPVSCLRMLAGSVCRCNPGGDTQPQVIDFCGRHALSCGRFYKSNARHDYIKKQWAAMFEEGGFTVMVEPSSWARVAARMAAVQQRRAHRHGDRRDGEGDDGDGDDGDVDDGVVFGAGEQLRPDIVVLGAAANGQNLALDVAFTMTALQRHEVPVYAQLDRRPAIAPQITTVGGRKAQKYDATARAKGEAFRGVIIGHSGQMSKGACYALELGVKAIAERRGATVGRTRAWWTNSLCTAHATSIAQGLLDASTAMADDRDVGTRRRIRNHFAEDVMRARDTDAAPSHCLAAGGFRRAHGGELPAYDLHDSRHGLEPMSYLVAQIRQPGTMG